MRGCRAESSDLELDMLTSQGGGTVQHAHCFILQVAPYVVMLTGTGCWVPLD